MRAIIQRLSTHRLGTVVLRYGALGLAIAACLLLCTAAQAGIR